MATNSVSFKWHRPRVERLEKFTKQGLWMMAGDMANKAKHNAPYLNGHLSNSIRRRWVNASEVEVVAGGKFADKDIRYAVRREFENKKHPQTKHYMKRAMESTLSGDWKQKYFGGITR